MVCLGEILLIRALPSPASSWKIKKKGRKGREGRRGDFFRKRTFANAFVLRHKLTSFSSHEDRRGPEVLAAEKKK